MCPPQHIYVMQPTLTKDVHIIAGHAVAEVAPDDSAAATTATTATNSAYTNSTDTTMEVNCHFVPPDTADNVLPPIRDLELGLELEPECEDSSIDVDHFASAGRPSSPNSVTSTDDYSFSSASWPGYKRERDCPSGNSPRRSSTVHTSTDGKSVSFSDLPVSHIWTRPKTEEEEKSDLYYSLEELQAFREDYRTILHAARDAKNRAMMASTMFGKLSTLLERASSLIHQVIVAGGECKEGEQHQHLLVDTLYLL
eukprot:CAMPEP_0181046198 /NCGR_PEP_ID=MMETSP1070-20121207/14217_1 /TAXON_ID=265543 /ORGANISM="Minutocellus polymorphus, Strain NH13" /LENGTH=253 /DNA_ID=CAMNT_0023124785 /DNA_START=66 /DNA_END=827 /DNA_ORIENTATION=+